MPDGTASIQVTERPASVRFAGMTDETALYAFLIEMHRELKGGWGHRYDPLLVSAKIEAGTRPQGQRSSPHNVELGFIGVIEGPDGRIIGSVGLFSNPFFWFSPVHSLVETWLYVRPEARDRRRLERQLFQFSNWLHDQIKERAKDGADPFLLLTGYMNLRHDDTPAKMLRLWRKLCGGRMIGALFGRE